MAYPFDRTFVLHAGVTFIASTCLFLACGGEDSNSGTNSSGYTLETVCDHVAPRVCELRNSCCTAAGIGFEQAGCEADFKSKCNEDVQAVNAGDETFDPSGLDACLAKLPGIYARCTLTQMDYVTTVLELRVCNAFEGKKGEGAACTRNSECRQSDDANTSVSCSQQTHSCTRVTVAKAGDGCGATTGAICEAGLYCDAPGLAAPGTCKTATSKGQACARPVIGNPECGIGSYCDGATATCVEAKAAREACTLPGECASGQCDSGTCSVGTPFVTAAECGK
jgi:hypothetical protein